MTYPRRYSRPHAKHAVAAGLAALCASVGARADDAGSEGGASPLVDAGSAPVEGGAGWVLTLDDEFDGTALDFCKWQLRHKWGERVVNHEREAYVTAAQASQAFTIENGILHIVARKQSGVYGGVTLPYTSGLLASIQNQQYGYYEIRSRMPKGSGLWPAFWLLRVPGLADIHEIDITEWVSPAPDTVLMTDHFGTNYDTNSFQTQFSFSASDLTSAFHVFGVDWEADRIVWYADGAEVGRVTTPGQLHDTEMYVIANLAVGGDLPGNPAIGAVFPASYDIDYIRVYQRDGTNPGAAPPFGPALSIPPTRGGAEPCGDAAADSMDADDNGVFEAATGGADAQEGGAETVDAGDGGAEEATEGGGATDVTDAADTTDAGVSPSARGGCGCKAAGRSRESQFMLPAALALLAIALGRRGRRPGHESSRS